MATASHANDTVMRIGQLAAATGVDVETIRYYERIGLLPAAPRSRNGYRVYGLAHLERLAFIRHCRSLDMSLDEVRRLLDFVDRPARDPAGIDRLIDAQLARVRMRLASLQALERQLARLREQCAGDHAGGECGILHELVAAAHAEACACHGEEHR
jgi:Cd(II)/Pb(II)-responsive transcriptional regulator